MVLRRDDAQQSSLVRDEIDAIIKSLYLYRVVRLYRSLYILKIILSFLYLIILSVLMCTIVYKINDNRKSGMKSFHVVVLVQ